MTNLYDPVAEARTIGLFNESVAKGVLDMRGVGGEVAWYLRPDGQAVRLPADLQSRDHYERKGFVFKRAWGVYARTPVVIGGRDYKPESEWQQLSRLAREHPDEAERAVIRTALGRVFSTDTRVADELLTCACGQVYSRRAAFENHQYGCVRALVAEPSPAATGAAPLPDGESPLPLAAAAAPVAKPPVPMTCRRCGITFEDKSAMSKHSYTAHRKRDLAGRYIDRRPATNAASGQAEAREDESWPASSSSSSTSSTTSSSPPPPN
jgi:hypothetical protein